MGRQVPDVTSGLFQHTPSRTAMIQTAHGQTCMISMRVGETREAKYLSAPLPTAARSRACCKTLLTLLQCQHRWERPMSSGNRTNQSNLPEPVKLVQNASCHFVVRFVVFLPSVRLLLVTANSVPSSPILVTLMMEAISSSETSVLTKAT
jgi:hypothetical protein